MSWIQWEKRITDLQIDAFLPHYKEIASVVLNRKVYCFTPYRYKYQYRYRYSVLIHVLSAEDFSWLESPVPKNRRSPVTSTCLAGAHDHKIYLCSENTQSPYLHCFDTREWRCTRVGVSGEFPPNERYRQACTVNGTMFVFRTYNATCSEVRMQLYEGRRLPRDIHALDLSTMVWRALGGFWPPNCYPKCFVAVGDKLYVLLMEVGKKTEGLFVEYFDTVTHSWVTPLRSSPPKGDPRVNPFSAFVHADHIYVTLLRKRRSEKQMLNYVLRYSVPRNDWEELRMAVPNEILCVSVVDNRAFFICNASRGWRLSILDFQPSLRTLCLSAVARDWLDTSQLPATLEREVQMYSRGCDATDEEDDDYYF